MTKADLYLKDGVDVDDFIRDITDNIGIVVTTSDITKPVGISIYADDFKKFLNTPLKPTLTEDEKVILKHIKNDVDSITRENGIWFHTKDKSKGLFSDLFQFIKERRRI